MVSEHAKLFLTTHLNLLEMNSVDNKIDIPKNQKNKIHSTKSAIKTNSFVRNVYHKFSIDVSQFSFIKNKYDMLKRLLYESFIKTNDDLKLQSFDGEYSGTTVCSVFIYGRNLICSNLGDSRAILGKMEYDKCIAVPLSRDHKPDQIDEKNRIISKNGRIEPYRSNIIYKLFMLFLFII